MRVAVLVAALTIPFAAGAAPSLENAKKALDGSDYPRARQELTELLATGTNAPVELAEIYRLLGIAAGAVGDTAAATDAFARCLALAPKTTLPDGTSPKITRPFDAAKKQVATPLSIKAETRNNPPVVVIRSVADPVEMIVRFRMTVRVDGTVKPPVEKPAAEEVELSVPSAARVDVWIVALDKHGNRLAEVGSSEVPLVIVGERAPDKDKKKSVVTQRPRSTARRDRPLVLQWWLWGGATVIAAGATGYFGLQAIDGRDTLQRMTSSTPNWDEFQATMSRTRRDVLVTNIGFGVTGAFGLVATILFLTRPDTSVAPIAVERGGGVAMGVRF